MPVTADHPAPYAPASAILALIDRHRNKGLQTPVDTDVLARSGISGSLIPRTLQALQTLDLIGDDAKPTPILEGLRLAPEGEFKARLAEWLNAAYADALSYVDPATDDEVRIRDAFRSYSPVGQQSRMVTLFTGLFSAAGIAPEKPKATPRKPQRSTIAAKPTAARQKGPASKQQGNGNPAGTAFSVLPPALSGLMASLPSSGQSWQKQDRDRFLHTFGAVLDFCFPVDDRPKQKQYAEQENDEGEG
ncbi:DUF5343 domain-containing protein [Manganibacter manganicus]|uniref:DUF5343 domain-containing protein n=1 Tax=Manganibacter manganicus TaxID=1873176 RepID=A0A1V8RTF0_9HYPH|nr:DUF5343 domain-containing protein [Pseudaminobacter manganicus]OQM76476.1 hypothetical protein BFN67_13915 [Pseudaminobacter manganicus]